MQELKLVGIHQILEGGSTYPLLINAQCQNKEIKQYVLKTYQENFVAQNYTVAKEILCCQMASEFDLPVPEYAIINFDHSALTKHYDLVKISTLDKGFKFCSEYHMGALDFNRFVPNAYLKSYEIENVFAFDNIVLNVDRGNKIKKTNLLILDNEMLLIDHELTFPFIDNRSNGMDIDYKSKFSSYDHSKHIFTDVLRRSNKKDLMFDEFHEYLKAINLDKFDTIINDFDSFNIEYGEKNRIFDYFVWLKKERDFVCKKLKERIL
ncbi:HipA family kinase [Arenibacter algicola]|uniref:HipA family kinase n=1 Tax=Arenibacter algicola TaxID=616991 RepID=UPI000852F0B6|nr:HipA family kinase [Arenibacter algicola]